MFYESCSSCPSPFPASSGIPRAAEEMRIRKGETFQAPQPALYLLHSGSIHLEAMNDDAGSQVVGTLLPGDPVGILAKYVAGVQFCYRAMEDCVLQKLSDDFLQETQDSPLASLVFRALSSATLRIILSHSAADMSRDYPRVREQVYRYMAEKQAGGLKDEKLLLFVAEQAALPQDLVSRVLSELTGRAYLDIRRGKLNAINFPLPLEYPASSPVSAFPAPTAGADRRHYAMAV